MSADEWDECPICHGLPEDLRKGYTQFYGKVSAKKYEELKEQYTAAYGQQTVPVYREATLNADGTVSLSLGAECDVCHAKWKHNGVVK